MHDLPLALMNEISKNDLARVVHADCECLELSSDGGVSVALENGDVHRVQHAISALPAWSLAKCVQSSVDPRLQELGRTAARIKFSDVAVVTLCFRKKQLQGGLPHAFGYLVPPRELQPIIGVTFDSQCFPPHHRSGDELIRLTAMLGGDASIAQLQRELCADTDKRILDLSCQSHRDEAFLVDVATSSVREHLGIVGEAVFSHASVLQQGIPLYDVRWKLCQHAREYLHRSTACNSNRCTDTASITHETAAEELARWQYPSEHHWEQLRPWSWNQRLYSQCAGVCGIVRASDRKIRIVFTNIRIMIPQNFVSSAKSPGSSTYSTRRSVVKELDVLNAAHGAVSAGAASPRPFASSFA